jgi:hypothetical protein
MTVETSKVEGRRKLTFASLDEIVADADKLAASPNTKMLGNWPLDRLLGHLAQAIERSIDGIAFKAPWYMRLLGKFLLKGRFLNKGFPAGFKLPREMEPEVYPAAPSLQEALARLQKAVARTRVEKMTARHPVLGTLTHEEWTRLHLRHAELHLSFAVPA